MARAHLKHTIRDRAGNVVQNALCYVYETGTTTAATDLFAAKTGGSAISGATLTSNSQGEIEGWLTTARQVDVKVTDNTDTAYYPADPATELSFTTFTEVVQVLQAPEDITTTTDHLTDASDAHDASAISIADAANDFTATDVEGALAELQSDAEAHAALAIDGTGLLGTPVHVASYGYDGMTQQMNAGNEWVTEAWQLNNGSGGDEVDILESGKMVCSVAYVKQAADVNCVNVGLGSRAPVGLTNFWAALYRVGTPGGVYPLGNTGPVATSVAFWPPDATTLGGGSQNDASLLDPTLLGGFLELYFGSSIPITAGWYALAVCAVGTTLPTLMGGTTPIGTQGNYYPPLSFYTGDTGLTDTPPTTPTLQWWTGAVTGGVQATWLTRNKLLGQRFYWRLEAPSAP